jgi:hypothetical protein
MLLSFHILLLRSHDFIACLTKLYSFLNPFLLCVLLINSLPHEVKGSNSAIEFVVWISNCSRIICISRRMSGPE